VILLSVFTWVGVLGCGGGSSSSVPPPVTKTTPATTSGNYTFTLTGTDSVNAKITVSTNVTVAVE
jgi:hypothetical protein